MFSRFLACSALLACCAAAQNATATPAGSVVFSFKSNGNGGSPEAGLAESGRAYFTTTFFGGHHHCTLSTGQQGQCGAAIRLLPPDAQHTAWRENAIYRFGPSPDASSPAGGITIGKERTFFLAAGQGGASGNGALVELTPPASGTGWTEQIIHSFAEPPDGSNPEGRPKVDIVGNLYVVASGGGNKGLGALIEFSPPAQGQGAWSERVLYSFGSAADGQGPTSSPESDGHGGFYVTTGGYANNGAGAVVDLVPGQGGSAWTENVLIQFGGANAQQTGAFAVGGVVQDAHGNLFGTTYFGGAYGNGLVYELSPPSGGTGAWTQTVLYAFTASGDGSNPDHAPHIDGAGNLFLTTPDDSYTSGGGTVVKLTPPGAGQSAWTETTLYHFPGEPGGDLPLGGLTVEDSGNFLVPTIAGGQYNQGAIVEVTGTGFVAK